MELKALQDRALQIREKFAAFEAAKTGNVWSRQEIMLGFVGDVGDLAKLVMAMEGSRHIDDKEAKLAHELADCLWSILVLAKFYEIDLEAAFQATMDELDNVLEEKLKAPQDD